MSYDDLEMIRTQGIDAIINLCGEFCDLHEIEENSGFEVYYLPIPDESAPDMEEMETALAWLDEALYLGKKVLVHCRFGIGRTGTFVTSYLLRKGLGLKVASKKLKKIRARPTNYSQWKLLRKYGKKEGVLKIREPSLESRSVVDLSSYFVEYQSLVRTIDEDILKVKATGRHLPACGLDSSDCCTTYVELQLIEVICLNNALNRTLTSKLRLELIHGCVEVNKKIREMRRRLADNPEHDGSSKKAMRESYASQHILCPLNRNSRCVLFENRPIQCRLLGVPEDMVDRHLIDQVLFNISRNVFFAFSGLFLESDTLTFSLAEAVSGRFVQKYFYYLMSIQK